jgi:hypothetical protein
MHLRVESPFCGDCPPVGEPVRHRDGGADCRDALGLEALLPGRGYPRSLGDLPASSGKSRRDSKCTWRRCTADFRKVGTIWQARSNRIMLAVW